MYRSMCPHCLCPPNKRRSPAAVSKQMPKMLLHPTPETDTQAPDPEQLAPRIARLEACLRAPGGQGRVAPASLLSAEDRVLTDVTARLDLAIEIFTLQTGTFGSGTERLGCVDHRTWARPSPDTRSSRPRRTRHPAWFGQISWPKRRTAKSPSINRR